MELQKGITLQKGKYTIEKKLGSGSFGITYLATMKAQVTGSLGAIETSVPVAVKEFFMSELNSRSADGSLVEGSQNTITANYRRKFRTEAENLGRMSHPHIVKVLEVWDENNTSYYSMEFVNGKSLDDNIREKGPIPEDKAIKMFSQLAGAVQYMHSKRMLHLDIKPKNVMMRSDGNLLLIDFGLSKQYDANGAPESSTRVGGGTPGYAPVEQADFHDGKEFPVTMDIYALGASLFKMLTGQTPPTASAIVNDGFPTEIFGRYKVSQETANVVIKAMSPSKRNRYQTVKDVLNALKVLDEEERTEFRTVESDNDERTEYDKEKNTKTPPKEKSVINEHLSDAKGKTSDAILKTKEWIKDQNIGGKVTNAKEKTSEAISKSKEWVKKQNVGGQISSGAKYTANGIGSFFQKIKEIFKARKERRRAYKTEKKTNSKKRKWPKTLLFALLSVIVLSATTAGIIYAILSSNYDNYDRLKSNYNEFLKNYYTVHNDYIDDGQGNYNYYHGRIFICDNGWCGLAYNDWDGILGFDMYKTIEPCSHAYVGHDGGHGFEINYETSHQRFLVEDNGKMGFVDGNFNWIVPQKYPTTDAEHLYGVVRSSDYGNDYNGKGVSYVFFAENLQPLKNSENGKWGYINRDGNHVIPFEYDDAYPFHFGLARVAKKDSTGTLKYGFINPDGEVVVDLQYEEAEDFRYCYSNPYHDSDRELDDFCYANVRLYADISGRYYVLHKTINAKTASLLKAQYSDGEYHSVGSPVFSTQAIKFRDGMGIIADYNDPQVIFGGPEFKGLIDYEGRIVVQRIYDEISFDGKGYAKVAGNGEYFKVDKEGHRHK